MCGRTHNHPKKNPTAILFRMSRRMCTQYNFINTITIHSVSLVCMFVQSAHSKQGRPGRLIQSFVRAFVARKQRPNDIQINSYTFLTRLRVNSMTHFMSFSFLYLQNVSTNFDFTFHFFKYACLFFLLHYTIFVWIVSSRSHIRSAPLLHLTASVVPSRLLLVLFNLITAQKHEMNFI